jgi:hypothetical protein
MSSQPICSNPDDSASLKKSAVPPQDKALQTLSCIALVVLVLALVIDLSGLPLANYMVVALTGCMITSVYVFIGIVELRLAASVINLKSNALLWLSVAGLVIWFAHIDAVSDVNELFGVDASLLPVTVAAATFMHVLMRFQFLCAAVIAVLLFLGLFTYMAARLRKEIPRSGISLIANALGFVLILSLIYNVIEPERRRNQILYHIAHMGDFNYASPCVNVDSAKDAVLYLDNSREKILIAPKIKEQHPTTLLTHSLLAPTLIPDHFEFFECVYAFGAKDQKNQNGEQAAPDNVDAADATPSD